MIAYAAYTTTKRNLAALAREDWRILLSPATGLQSFGLPCALDNGAWSAFTAGTEWDHARFVAALEALGAVADWVALPDIVEGGKSSLARSLAWKERVLASTGRVLIPTQDGLVPADLAPHLGKRVGIFVGGSTRHKEDTLPLWGELAREKGCWLHVGRVNTARRIALCAAARAKSFDGSSATKYATTLPLIENARRQPDLFA